jgi:hypothetical protein
MEVPIAWDARLRSAYDIEITMQSYCNTKNVEPLFAVKQERRRAVKVARSTRILPLLLR